MAHNLELTYTRPNTSVAWHTVPEEIIDIIIATILAIRIAIIICINSYYHSY